MTDQDNTTPRSELRFVGQIADLKFTLPKASTGFGGGTAGKTVLTLHIDRPEPPRKPYPPYPLNNGGERPKPFGGKAPKAPGKLQAKKDETPEDLAKRQDAADLDYQRRKAEHDRKVADAQATIDRWDKAKADYDRALAVWNEQASKYPEQLAQYANLSGIIAALGSAKCDVTIAPRLQDMLPGFTMSAHLLEAPEDVPDPVDVYDDDDWDDDE